MSSFYWHDYETWGVSPAQDKPSQFAGVRTDENLEIIGEPLMVYCRPTTDCLPNPDACLVTGLTPQKARADGLVETEFMAAIYQELSQPGTCGVGYNSIRFDDEVTRYGLYRNFYDPYEREWQNGNSRWDIIDMVRMVYALRPDTLEWPRNDDGTPSFKLERLSKANGLLHEAAHDALSDVYATIALAKLIKERQPKLFAYAYSLRKKQAVSAQIDLVQRKPLLHISSRFAAQNGCASIIAPLMFHPVNSNSVICFDLSQSPEMLIQQSADSLHESLYSKQEELPEGAERVALKQIHLNKSPVLATVKLLEPANAERLGIDLKLCEQHWQQLLNCDLNKKLGEVFRRNPFAKPIDPEQQLYEGFITDSDKRLLPMIRSASAEQLDSFEEQLGDERLRALLFRYRARFYPETLTEQEREQWQQWCYQRLTDPAMGASLVLEDFFERLQILQEEPELDQTVIQALFDYGDELLAHIG